MSVSKKITRLEKSSVRLSLTIPKEDVVAGYRKVLGDYTKDAQLPGFRKGKVPPAVLERKFGEALKGEALGKILEKAVEEVFADENMPVDERPLPYMQPRMEDDPKLDLEQDLTFSLVYDVKPKVTVDRWKGLEIEVPDAEVSDDDVARELEVVRDRNSFVLDRDDDAQARNGDIVTISYHELDENGDALPDTGRDDFVYTLGSGQSAYMYDDEIVGMVKGETKEFTKTFPEAEAAEGENALESDPFAGQTVKLRLTLTTVKEKKLPDLDDELAQDVDEKFNTLDDLKKSIRDRLESSLAARIRELKISSILEKIMETTPVTLPESMVRAEIGGRIGALARNFGLSNEAVMRMLTAGGDGLDDIEGKWRPAAEKSLHSRLIVEAIMEEHKIEVSDDEVKKELEEIATGVGKSEEELREHYKDEQLENLRNDIMEQKFFDFLLSENTIKTGSKTSYLDLMGNNG